MTDPRQNILVIKLSALGDFVQAFPAFAAIRAHHPGARITLLTTPPFAPLARRAPWFDEVWEEGRPRSRDLGGLWRLGAKLRAGRFARVYDMQASGRSTRYRWLMGPGVEWSGLGFAASHPHANPRRDFMHTLDRQREQLEMAGITRFPPPELGWLDGDVSAFGLPERFVLMVPGGSAHRPLKRWPVARYAELASGLGLPVAVLGSPSEAPLAREIVAAAPGGFDLTGRTGFGDIAALARRAAGCVGNDTGPVHMVAACGCPTVVLFGSDSDPALCAPRGRRVEVLRRDTLAGLPVAEVRAALDGVMA